MAQKDLRQFGAWLKRLREQKGVSQARVVSEVGVSLRTIGRWENGEHEPYLSELAPVIHYLDGDLNQAVSLIVLRPHQEAA